MDGREESDTTAYLLDWCFLSTAVRLYTGQIILLPMMLMVAGSNLLCSIERLNISQLAEGEWQLKSNHDSINRRGREERFVAKESCNILLNSLSRREESYKHRFSACLLACMSTGSKKHRTLIFCVKGF